MFLPLAFAVPVLCLASAPHPRSVSSARIEVSGTHIVLQLRTEARTLLESLPLDADGDRRLSRAELEAGVGATADYVGTHFVLQSSVESWDAGAPALAGQETRAEVLDVDSTGFFGTNELVDLTFDFECATPPTSLALNSTLFTDDDPWHRCQVDVVWNGASAVGRMLWVEDPTWVLRPDAPTHAGAMGAFVHLGIEHILTGFDHVAFLIALIVASRRVRTLVGVVTAFTLAHSLTLTAAALGVVHVPAQPVEVTIAASIAYVALRNLLGRKPRRLWPEAFGFGLVHGLGFAGAISATLAAEPAQLQAIVGFNAGVELGQLAIVTAAVVILQHLPRRAASTVGDSSTLAPGWLRQTASGVVGVLGLVWVIGRLGAT